LIFDYSGTYLACAGTDVRIFQVKQWDTLKTLNDHTGIVTGVRFGTNANTLVTTSLDKSLKIYSKEN
jgi:pre-mRNA-processing factor 19